MSVPFDQSSGLGELKNRRAGVLAGYLSFQYGLVYLWLREFLVSEKVSAALQYMALPAKSE